MSKYYVQSGTLRTIVQAESSRKAALWAIHQTMQQVLPMEDDGDDSPATKSEKATREGVTVLSTKVTVSERGFDNADATEVPTIEIVADWNEMVTTLDRLERMLYRAA